MTTKMSGKKERALASEKLSLVQARKYEAKTKSKSDSGVKSKATKLGVAPNERLQMIAEAAYYCAEKRGFDPEKQMDDWLEAETMVDAVLKGSKHRHGQVSH